MRIPGFNRVYFMVKESVISIIAGNDPKSIDKYFLQTITHTVPQKKSKIKKNDRGFLFVGSKGRNMNRAVGSIANLCYKFNNEEYVTASVFYKARSRSKNTLRWLNAIVVDIDAKSEKTDVVNPEDMNRRIMEAGLPQASMMVRTPSGGIHLWWHLFPVRATDKAVKLFEALQKSLATALKGDPSAVGAERLWRMPTLDKVIYSSCARYELSELRRWRDDYRPQDRYSYEARRAEGLTCENFSSIRGINGALLKNEGIKQLMQAGFEADTCRNNVCFSLAVAYLASGASIDEVDNILHAWNGKNIVPLDEKEVDSCINSAARGLSGEYWKYINAMKKVVRTITGKKVNLIPFNGARDRSKRKRSHIYEWMQDILDLIEIRGGVLCITQKKLAEMLNAPLRSVKEALKSLNKTGKVSVQAIKRGRKSITVLILKAGCTQKNFMVHTGIQYTLGEPPGFFYKLFLEVIRGTFIPIRGDPSQ